MALPKGAHEGLVLDPRVTGIDARGIPARTKERIPVGPLGASPKALDLPSLDLLWPEQPVRFEVRRRRHVRSHEHVVVQHLERSAEIGRHLNR